jgi:hypothetical protein
LIKGYWSYALPSVGIEKLRTIPLANTRAGILFDILSRLPDPDRQRGKIIGKAQLTTLIFNWFAKSPKDFYPPIDEIKRTPYEKFKGTVTGWYLGME